MYYFVLCAFSIIVLVGVCSTAHAQQIINNTKGDKRYVNWIMETVVGGDNISAFSLLQDFVVLAMRGLALGGREVPDKNSVYNAAREKIVS